MNPESFTIDVLIAYEGLSGRRLTPYSTRTVVKTWLDGSLSLDKPMSKSPSKLERKATLADLIPANCPSPEEIAIEKDTERRIQQLAETSGLTPRQKEVFNLWCFGGWHPSEIARFLGFKGRQHVQNLITKSIKKIYANPEFAAVFGLETD